MRRFLHALLVGAVGAGLVHVAIVMGLPKASADAVWRRVQRAVPPGRATGAEPLVFAPDPFLRRTVCRFDLGQGARRLQAEGTVPAWFLSIHAPDGRNLAELDDRSVPEGSLDVLLFTPARRAASDPPLAQVTPVEVDGGEVLALLEVFVPDATWSDSAAAFLASLGCNLSADGQ